MAIQQTAAAGGRECYYLVDEVGAVTCHCLEQGASMEDIDVPEGSVIFADPTDAVNLAILRSQAYIDRDDAMIADKHRASQRLMDMQYRLASFLQSLQKQACHDTSPP